MTRARPQPPPQRDTRTGVVVARYRSGFLVEDRVDGTRDHCLAARRNLRPVAGDEVDFLPARNGDPGRIVRVGRRRSCLERIDSRGRPEPLAANLTMLVVVIAPLPPPDLFIADRYLCAAGLLGLRALVVANKADLRDHWSPALSSGLDYYAAAGYTVMRTRVGDAAEDDLAGLAAALADEVASFVGQSGVGKSSLVNALVPAASQPVGDISARTREGRHTTTTATLFRLPGGGAVIDSPGVRGYSPPLPPPADVQRGYPEIVARADACRFQDCHHRAEPGCAVLRAVEAGEVSQRRYQSYAQLLQLAERFNDPRVRR